jgi:hypothetical protein
MYEHIYLKTDVTPIQLKDSEYLDLMNISDTECRVYDKLTKQAMTIEMGGGETLGRLWSPPSIEPFPVLYILAKEFLVEYSSYSNYNRVYDAFEENSLCYSDPVYLDYDYAYRYFTELVINWVESGEYEEKHSEFIKDWQEQNGSISQLNIVPKVESNKSESASVWCYYDDFYPPVPAKFFYGYDIPYELCLLDTYENLQEEANYIETLEK